MTDKPEAFDIEAAKRFIERRVLAGEKWPPDANEFMARNMLRDVISDLERERAEHAAAIEAACRAQRERDKQIVRMFAVAAHDAAVPLFEKAIRDIADAIGQSPLVTEQHDGEKG